MRRLVLVLVLVASCAPRPVAVDVPEVCVPGERRACLTDADELGFAVCEPVERWGVCVLEDAGRGR